MQELQSVTAVRLWLASSLTYSSSQGPLGKVRKNEGDLESAKGLLNKRDGDSWRSHACRARHSKGWCLKIQPLSHQSYKVSNPQNSKVRQPTRKIRISELKSDQKWNCKTIPQLSRVVWMAQELHSPQFPARPFHWHGWELRARSTHTSECSLSSDCSEGLESTVKPVSTIKAGKSRTGVEAWKESGDCA